jgi:hypothetical protein
MLRCTTKTPILDLDPMSEDLSCPCATCGGLHGLMQDATQLGYAESRGSRPLVQDVRCRLYTNPAHSNMLGIYHATGEEVVAETEY